REWPVCEGVIEVQPDCADFRGRHTAEYCAARPSLSWSAAANPAETCKKLLTRFWSPELWTGVSTYIAATGSTRAASERRSTGDWSCARFRPSSCCHDDSERSEKPVLYRDMCESIRLLKHLSDPELLAEVKRLAESERLTMAHLVSALAELDARRLYLGQGCSSMFTYCTQVLHFAEHAAFNRIEAARAARRFPVILTLLGTGRLHLSAVRLLAPHLTEANHQAVLGEASHKSKREVEQIVARLLPKPDVAASVRKLPSRDVPVPTVRPLMAQSAPIEVAGP